MGHGNRLIDGLDMKTADSILDCIEKEGPLSRASVAKRLDLSRTTLSNLISRFMEQKLVAELEGTNPLGRGRPGIPVDIDTSTWFALGAEFHSGRWVFVIVNLKGEVVATETVKVDSDSADGFLAALVKGVKRIGGKSPGRLLPAVGVGVPGLVNWEEGTIIRAADLGWEQVPIKETVEKATGLAVYALNRNRATGIAEARCGKGRNVDNFVYIGIGTGISAAIMLGGKLLHGSSYGAGEIGHLTVDPKGPECGCGRRGCLQTLAAGGALVRKARQLLDSGKAKSDGELARALSEQNGSGGEAVCLAAMAGDKMALSCVRSAASYLAMAVGSLVTTLNPEKVIFGGPLVRVGPILVDLVRQEASKWVMPHSFSFVSLDASELDEYAGALGAACLVLARKLDLSSTVSES